MPKITIYESDNTGSTYNGDEINVFVPGNCTLAGAKPELNLEVKVTEEKSKKYVTFLDATIDPTVTYYITGVTDTAINVTTTKADFTTPSGLTANVNATYSNAASKYDLVYDFASNVFIVKKYVALHNFDEHDCMLISANSNISEYLSEGSDKSYKYVEDLLKAGLGVVYFSGTPSGTGKNLEFLKDYNAYNVEVLTMGAPSSIPDSFNKDLANYLIDICGSRKDCFALIDYSAKVNNDTMISVKQALNDDITSAWAQYAAAFVDWNINTGMPGSYTYLMKLADANVGGKRWDSVSGVQRGVVNSIYSGSNIKMDKYTLDNVIQTKVGRSYNGIVKVRPYGWTIWGDRTLLANDEGTGLKATSFLSIRLMICDIVKRAYNAAINNTFESNNDITWTNYKLEIQTLLDRMVASGKLASYKLVRKATTDRAKIACIIRLVPNEPVEDFDIYIDLQNGSAEVTEG